MFGVPCGEFPIQAEKGLDGKGIGDEGKKEELRRMEAEIRHGGARERNRTDRSYGTYGAEAVERML